MSDDNDIRHARHCVFKTHVPWVFVAKYRRRVFDGPAIDALSGIFASVCRDFEATLVEMEAICRSTAEKWGCEVLEFNGEADHVHLLLALTPKVLPSAFVNNLKTVTSRLLRKEFADHLKRYYWSKPVFWSRSDCILTVGGAPLSVLKQYIEQQERPE